MVDLDEEEEDEKEIRLQWEIYCNDWHSSYWIEFSIIIFFVDCIQSEKSYAVTY